MVPFQRRETIVSVTSSSAFKNLIVQRISVHLAVLVSQSYNNNKKINSDLLFKA